MPELPLPLRVLFVTSSLQRGGAERHVATMMPALDRERFEVRVICTQDRGPFFDVVADAGIPVDCLDAGDGLAATSRALRQLVGRMRRWRPDVVMSSGYHADVLARLAARRAKVPTIVAWRHNCGHLAHYGRRDRITERLSGFLVRRYFAVAYGQLSYLTDELRLPAAKIRVIHNSIPAGPEPMGTSRSGALAPRSVPVVIAVSVLRPEKDHPTILRAMRRVVDMLPDARLVVVGDGPERSRLEGLTAELGLAANVSFLGDRNDVGDLLTAADVLALASYTVECLPYTVLEAMAAALPVVSTTVGGLPELVEDGVTGFLVPIKDSTAIATALIHILSDNGRAQEIGAAGRQRLLSNFAFADIVAQLESETMTAAGRAPEKGRLPRD